MRRLFFPFGRRLAQDAGGVAAIEFALIAPVMILIYFGLVEFSQGYMAQRRANHAASVVADLIAQSDQTNKADLDAVFKVGGLIMRPFSSTPLAVRASSITINPNGIATVEWSYGKSAALPSLARGTRITDLPPEVIAAGQTVILGETQYAYRSALGALLPNPVTFKRKYYLRPRTVERIACADCPA